MSEKVERRGFDFHHVVFDVLQIASNKRQWSVVIFAGSVISSVLYPLISESGMINF